MMRPIGMLARKAGDSTNITTSNCLALYPTLAGGIRVDVQDEDATLVHVLKEDLHHIPEIIALLQSYVNLSGGGPEPADP